MTVKEAWSFVRAKFNDVKPETAYELEKIYVFSIRPADTKPGFGTGAVVITVDRNTGEVSSLPADSPELRQGSHFRFIDPSTL